MGQIALGNMEARLKSDDALLLVAEEAGLKYATSVPPEQETLDSLKENIQSATSIPSQYQQRVRCDRSIYLLLLYFPLSASLCVYKYQCCGI